MAGLDRLILCLRLIAMGFLFRQVCVLYNFAFQLAILSDRGFKSRFLLYVPETK